MASIRKFGCFLILLLILGSCDVFPGLNLRSEFPTEAKLTINYDDGTIYSEVWPPCRTVFIGAYEAGRFGMVEKSVSIERITIEVNNEILHDLERKDIEQLIGKSAEQSEHQVWVIDGTGIRITTDDACSLEDQ